MTGVRGSQLASPADFMAAARKQMRISSTDLPRGSVSDTTQAAQKESEASVVSVPPTEVGVSQSTPLDAKESELATKEPTPKPAKLSFGT